ncbi:insecticidal delta-endotoxin Cry8Ea1 family protein [Bacillus cereus]|uniref:Crystaline entomocidal protoxin n=3 Tax=Bacillus cereus group TaxID=86661 RepID=V9I0N5_BACTU|nr:MULTISPECIES: insecticidal delta-endotoxin Cry8Ea1 family protein [Bacillus cereus group]AEB52310.1 Cry0032 [Bacillus thuringiensis]MEB8733201.1 insecticidal delta-endotoxin Cry8Ea1 family protein [Bacillus cereus]EEM44315.1 Pesticidal crystal protein cry5Ba [Bacillus thuringiensis serovar pakistani str. T13001]EJR70782.1 pesticidal crystal protein cry5Aa [Bacillus cereus VD154]KIU74325.1 pesticidial crystal protein cry4AA [Bacillus thuringiensis Sbt003]
MVTVNEIYPSYYNVLASPYVFESNTDSIEKAVDDFRKGLAKGDVTKQVVNIIESIKDGKFNYQTVITSILSLASMVLPEIGFFMPIIGLFFSALSGGGPSIDIGSIFKAIQPAIQQMIDKSLTEDNIKDMDTQATVLQTQLKAYQTQLKAYTSITNPGTTDISDLHRVLDNTIEQLNSNLAFFQKEGYKDIGLPYYCLFATLYFTLLSDKIKNGVKWGYNSQAIPSFQTTFDTDLASHTQYVLNTYFENMPKSDDPARDARDDGDDGDAKFENKKAKYIRGMTLSCLDYVSLWPTFSPRDYSQEVDVEQTRTIVASPNISYFAHNIAPPPYHSPLSRIKIYNIVDPLYYGLPIIGAEKWDQSGGYETEGKLNGVQTPSVTFPQNDPVIQTLPCVAGPAESIIGVIGGYTFNLKSGNQLSLLPDHVLPMPCSLVGGLVGDEEDVKFPDNHKLNYMIDAKTSGYSVTVFENLVPENIIGQPVDTDNGNTVLQIKGFPAEKGRIGNPDQGELHYVYEPGNGAAAIDLKPYQILELPFYNYTNGDYHVRIRYASKSDIPAYFSVNTPNGSQARGPITLPNTETQASAVPGMSGKYAFNEGATVTIPVVKDKDYCTVNIQNNSQEALFIDRIEFVPKTNLCDNLHCDCNNPVDTDCQMCCICASLTDCDCNNPHGFDCAICCSLGISHPSFVTLTDLQNITTQVNALFASETKNMLAKEVNDHDIEEVVLKVDALSDEVFGTEKKALRKLVNQAKRLSKARNLLVGGSFENWDAWYKGQKVIRLSDHELLKGDHVFLPSPTLYPSYIFQKVEESKLKPNTRYTVSGFIAHAIGLEIVVSRYGQEIKKVVQVPYGEAFPLTPIGRICCQSYSTSNGKPVDPHFFSYSIDVGALDVEANPGIEFGLRIVERTGMARVSNLEIREDRSLTANELRIVQRAARDWKTTYDQERAEVTALIQPVLNQINGLYENGDWNGVIRSGISYHDVESIVLPTLPKLRHWFISDMLSAQGNIIARFQEVLNFAHRQLEENTLLHNGHFTTDAANWTVEGDAHQRTLEDGRRVLRFPDWSSSVSQTIEIENFDPNKEYQLVFHGQGEGTVTLEHGEETKYIETHTHHFANFTTSQRQGLTFESNKVTVTISSEDGEFLVDNIALVEVPMFNKNQMVNENRGININSNTNMNSSNNQ